MSDAIIAIFILLTAIITSGIFIAVYFFVIKKNIIKDKHCNAPLGAFAVNPGKAANSGNQITAVNNLQDAENKCITNDQCKSFVYDENAKTMQIVSLTSTKINDKNKNLYTLQTGVTVL
jgi:hypothetical protein